jgi:hypothetical protein
MVKVFRRIIKKLRDIFDLLRIKDLRPLNSIMEIALRMVSMSQRTRRKLQDISDLSPFRDPDMLNINMLARLRFSCGLQIDVSEARKYFKLAAD